MGELREEFPVCFADARVVEYTWISRSGDRLLTRVVSLGGSRPSVLLRKRLYSRHGKLEEGGQKVARKQTDEQSRKKTPLC